MKIKLLSILLVLAFIMSLSSCAVTNDTTDTETTEAEDTETYESQRIDIPMWLGYASTSYAIVKVTDITEDTEKVHNEDKDIYYKRFICRQVYSTRKGFPFDDSLLIAEDPEQKIELGDYIFFQVKKRDHLLNHRYIEIGSRSVSEYKVFTDGTIELTENDLLTDAFYPISVINEESRRISEWSQPDNITPSFPTKELRGKVTVEEISDFLDSIQKARDEFFAYMNDPEIRKAHRF